ncbi:MAG: SUMF1/EgtB/PvdO family nonheme iron enzyme [Nitrospinae bacterium]|nr:SUMF1/EgtB/PvdO family nonheme iron enzyme [Nitrospinota bacterium]
MKFFLAVSLTLLMAVGCASNHPELKTGLSKSQSSGKNSVTVPPRKISVKPRAIPKRYLNKLPPSASRFPTKKILLPTIANGKDGSLMVLVNSGAQNVSVLNHPRGIIRPANPVSHAKIFPAFYMDRLEITVAQYKKFDGKYDEQPFTDGRECPDCPAMGIDWISAHRYCLWAGKRLPTDAEWVTAAGGNSGNSWPWGNQFFPERANLWGDEDGSLSVAPVGSYPQGASHYGLMDTVGNVWEWISDPYFASSGKFNKVTLRIVKGGGWTSDKREARISFRNIVDPNSKNPTIGFRCAKPIHRESLNHR